MSPLLLLLAGGASPLLNNLTAFWGFDEASGNALDSGPNALTLTANGAPGTAAGQVGTSRVLVKASSQYFSRADETLLRFFRGGAVGATLAWWQFPTTNPASVICAASKDNGNATDREFFQGRLNNANSELDVYNGTTGASVGQIIISDATSGWAINTWVFHAIRWDGGTGLTFNVNNAKATAVLSGTPSPGGTAPFRFGSQVVGNSFFPDSRYDQAGLWGRALSDAELAAYKALTRGYPFS